MATEGFVEYFLLSGITLTLLLTINGEGAEAGF
jgi:hypothetical protein